MADPHGYQQFHHFQGGQQGMQHQHHNHSFDHSHPPAGHIQPCSCPSRDHPIPHNNGVLDIRWVWCGFGDGVDMDLQIRDREAATWRGPAGLGSSQAGWEGEGDEGQGRAVRSAAYLWSTSDSLICINIVFCISSMEELFAKIKY
ncbi:unnamed protein product [Malus baccata var. baccata]